MPTLPVVLQAPLAAPGAGGVEITQRFTREAIVPDSGNGPLDASFVFGMPDTGRVNVEGAGLGVLEKRLDQPGLEVVRGPDDRLRVIRILCPLPFCALL